ncbi:PepSY domain-containing protein [Saccharicrinis fermentans]|uniref:PepSY domain-containing protein n=1 Tax=Saccharicrinis fermentans TaxID=982 RepID=UPI0012697B05|nr:PepSY domain-containing protein [Saccharicrinis fermentans]
MRKIERMDDLSQWVPWNYYKPLLPFYKCYMADKEHTVLYVSAKTGEIIQETKRLERWSARLGAIPHWIYFKQLRSLEKTWRLVVIILASLGILMTVTGIYAGVIRYRKRSKNSITPYKKFWYKWHHITGFFFGFFVFTFVLSGLISVSSIPDWMVGVKKSDKVKVGWNQKLDLRMHHHTTPWNIYKALDNKDGVRKIEWKSVLGQAQYHVYYEDYQKPDVYTLYNDSVISQRPYSMSDIQSQANILLGQIPFSIQEQFTYDNYYAGSGMIYLPQPAYKIMVDDVANTWLYIDPASGEAVKTLTRNTRLRRWLYRFLHTLDIPMLKKMDGLRKTILVLLCLMGLAISVTGFVIGIKWFKRNLGW